MTINATAPTATERLEKALDELDAAVATLRTAIDANPPVDNARLIVEAIVMVTDLARLTGRPVSSLF